MTEQYGKAEVAPYRGWFHRWRVLYFSPRQAAAETPTTSTMSFHRTRAQAERRAQEFVGQPFSFYVKDDEDEEGAS